MPPKKRKLTADNRASIPRKWCMAAGTMARVFHTGGSPTPQLTAMLLLPDSLTFKAQDFSNIVYENVLLYLYLLACFCFT